ncbi:MAG: hypothetical protein M0Z41_04665 [Peptococcaceae bacterium]|nr:hypothetical protein [Peptococcaceae bacterium]
MCRFVEDHEYEAFLRRNTYHTPRIRSWVRLAEKAKKVVKPCGCGGTCGCR